MRDEEPLFECAGLHQNHLSRCLFICFVFLNFYCCLVAIVQGPFPLHKNCYVKKHAQTNHWLETKLCWHVWRYFFNLDHIHHTSILVIFRILGLIVKVVWEWVLLPDVYFMPSRMLFLVGRCSCLSFFPNTQIKIFSTEKNLFIWCQAKNSLGYVWPRKGSIKQCNRKWLQHPPPPPPLLLLFK